MIEKKVYLAYSTHDLGNPNTVIVLLETGLRDLGKGDGVVFELLLFFKK